MEGHMAGTVSVDWCNNLGNWGVVGDFGNWSSIMYCWCGVVMMYWSGIVYDGSGDHFVDWGGNDFVVHWDLNVAGLTVDDGIESVMIIGSVFDGAFETI